MNPTPLRTLTHRKGPDTEREALVKVLVPNLEQRVFGVIKAAGVHGATLKEICRALGKEKNEISPRLTSLQDARRLIHWDLPRKREGCRVMVVTDIEVRRAA